MPSAHQWPLMEVHAPPFHVQRRCSSSILFPRPSFRNPQRPRSTMQTMAVLYREQRTMLTGIWLPESPTKEAAHFTMPTGEAGRLLPSKQFMGGGGSFCYELSVLTSTTQELPLQEGYEHVTLSPLSGSGSWCCKDSLYLLSTVIRELRYVSLCISCNFQVIDTPTVLPRTSLSGPPAPSPVAHTLVYSKVPFFVSLNTFLD